MNQVETDYWLHLQRVAGRSTPQLAIAILKAFAVIRQSFGDFAIVRMIESGQIESVLSQALNATMMESAFQPVRDRVRSSVGQSIAYFARELPKAPPEAPAGANIRVGFNILSPKVIEGVRTLETKVITGLQDDVRETVRAFIENGLRDGRGAASIARDIRPMIGLGPTQLQEVENYRDALKGLNGRNFEDYVRRDRRYDATIRKALGPEGKGLRPEQVEKMTQRYADRRIAMNAETVARTASLDSFKLGQHLSMADAVQKGIYDGNRLTKRWSGVMDSRERDSHVAMQGETVPWDQPYSNGQMYCGQDEFNCRCVSFYAERK